MNRKTLLPDLLSRSFSVFLFLAFSCALHAQNVAVNTSGTAAASTNMFEVTQSSAAANMVALYAINNGATGAGLTGYGLQAIKSGTSGGANVTNVAGYFSASGATNNYAIIVPATGGRTGLGTITPQSILHLENGEAKVTFYDIDAAGPSAARPAWQAGSSGASFTIRSTADYAAFTDRIWIDATGNVGIGTTVPLSKLNIAASTGIRLDSPADDVFPAITAATRTTGGEIRAGSGLNADYGTLILSAGGETGLGMKMSIVLKGYGLTDNSQIRFLSGNTSLMTILMGGNIGIGTTTPSAQLHTTGTVRFANYPSGFLSTDGSGNVNSARSMAVSGTGIAVTNGNGVSGNPIFNLSYGSVAVAPGGTTPLPAGNFGQFELHGTYADFNTTPNYWGWNFLAGSTNGPNATSSQWYREIISLGSNYIGRGAGGYSLELAFPRFNHSTAGVWMRTVENGGYTSWYRLDGGSSGWGLTGNAGTVAGTNYCGTSDAVDFSLGTNGARRLTVTSGGNVGIGTTGPGYKCVVQVPGNITPGDSLNGLQLTDGTRWMLFQPGTVGAQSWNNITKAWDNAIIFNGGALTLAPWAGGPTGMRIETNGNVGIGIHYLSTTSAQFHTTGTVRFQALASGGATLNTDASGNVTASSDSALKIIQSEFKRGLSSLMGIQPVIYKWNRLSGLETEHAYAGFIAQNVQRHIPEAVMKGENGYLTLADRPILATLVNAVKEQQQIIDSQRSDIDALKLENEKMQAANLTRDKEISALKGALEILLKQANAPEKSGDVTGSLKK